MSAANPSDDRVAAREEFQAAIQDYYDPAAVRYSIWPKTQAGELLKELGAKRAAKRAKPAG